jgi:hypothetical protein
MREIIFKITRENLYGPKCTFVVTNYKEQMHSWEADSCSYGKEILWLYIESEGFLPFQKKPLTDPILSQINPILTTASYCFNIHFNNINLSRRRKYYLKYLQVLNMSATKLLL